MSYCSGVELVAALWENYADELTAYVNAREEVADESIVLILQFVILSSYNCEYYFFIIILSIYYLIIQFIAIINFITINIGIHRVTTMVGATKMHINPTFPEHAEFRKKFVLYPTI